nr:AAA family ATPase [Glycomyces buryatensis]
MNHYQVAAPNRQYSAPPEADQPRSAPPFGGQQPSTHWPSAPPETAYQHSAPPAPTPSPGSVPVPFSATGPAFPDQPGTLERLGVTADDFANRRVVPPRPPVAETGLRGALHRFSFGMVALPPSPRERARGHAVETVRRNFGGLRQITVVNPKGGAGKTVAVLMLAMTFGCHRGGYVLAWDNNETQGTLGMRAQQDFHVRTVRDLLRDLDHFRGPTGRVGDLSQYVRAQGGAMFDVLASDESATAGEMLTSQAFGDLREAVSRFYKLIVVDTGNNVRAANWQAAIDATDQLVITMSARNDSAETAARMLDHLEQTGRRDLVRGAVSVVSMPAHRKDVDLPAVQRHFAARTRAVLLAPYEKLLDSGEPIRYDSLSKASMGAWLRIGSAVAEGL